MYRVYRVYVLHKTWKIVTKSNIIAKDINAIANYFNTENDIILEISLISVDNAIKHININNDDIINNKKCVLHSDGIDIFYSEKVPETNEIYDDSPVIFIN
jgi:hypothetical protein